MPMHVFITNLSFVVPERDGVFENQKVARSRHLWTARTSQMLTARTDCSGSQHFAQPTLQPVMQPRDEAQAGPTLFTHWATWVWLCQQDMSAVAPRGHRMCTHLDIQGLRDNPPLCVADYCLVPCTPPLHATHVQARNFVVVGIVCISMY